MEVSLKRDGWHCKLQKWTFGKRTPQFNSLCPFFWLTVFCLLVSPVSGLRDLVKFVVSGTLFILDAALNFTSVVLENLISFVDVKVCQPMYESKVERVAQELTDEEAFDLYSYVCYVGDRRTLKGWDDSASASDFSFKNWKNWVWDKNSDGPNKKARVALDQLDRWSKKVGEGWEKRLAEIHKLAKERKELALQAEKKAEEERRLRDEKLKKLFNNIVIYTKYLVFLVLGIVGIYALYALAIVGLILYENAGSIGTGLVWFFKGLLDLVINWGPFLLLCAAGVGVAIFVISLAVKLLRKCTLGYAKKPRTKEPWLVRLFMKIEPVVGFFVMYFKAAKQNYCPRIDWKE